VTFGGKAGTKLTVTSATTLTVITPAGTNGKTVKVIVTAAGGASNAASYLYANAPHITSLSPTSGPAKGGTKLTIHGTSFIGVKSVTLAGKAGTSLKVTSATALTITTPKGAKGKVKLLITAAGGTSNTVVYLYT
jgi:hypothetical protein